MVYDDEKTVTRRVTSEEEEFSVVPKPSKTVQPLLHHGPDRMGCVLSIGLLGKSVIVHSFALTTANDVSTDSLKRARLSCNVARRTDARAVTHGTPAITGMPIMTMMLSVSKL